MRWTLPWRRPADANARLEAKAGYGFVTLHMEGDARWTRLDYGGLAREGFMKNPVAHRAVRVVAEAASTLPWALYDGKDELAEHPMLELLAQPNAGSAGPAFMEALYATLLISGNAYVQAIGADGARELHLLRPDKVAVVADAGGWPVAIDYRSGSRKERIPLRTPGGGEGGALHLKLFHPLDEHNGFAPLQAASMALDLHNASARWNKALLDNSARPSGALVYAPREGGGLTEDQREQLRLDLAEQYSGAAKAGRPLLLEGGLDWKQMSLSPKDMDFLEARNGAARDIALALGVPPMLLGIPGDNTYANYAEANRALYRQTVLPLVGKTAQALGNWLSPLFGDRLRLWYDADQVEALASDRDSLWARVGAAEFLTEDEKREAVGYGRK
jgi:HK97 family phage portal protein